MSTDERVVDAADRRLRVLISSNPAELPEERTAARSAVRTLRLVPVTPEPGADHPFVAPSDVFVGIYWETYGWIPPDGRTSATEDEFHRCADRPRLVYLKEPSPRREPALARLVENMGRGAAICRPFATPGELAELLIDDLAALVSERFYGGRTRVRDLPEGTVSFAFVDMEGSTPIVRLLGDDWARTILAGLLPHFEADLTRALGEVCRAIEIFRADDNVFGLATALGVSGTITTLLGRAAEGMAELDEGLAAAKRVGLPSLIGANHSLCALASLTAGHIAEARAHLEEAAAAPLYLEGTAFCLEGLAAVTLAEGDPVRAAAALGAAEGLRERTGIQMWPVVRMAFEPAVGALDAAGPDVETARYQGRRINPRDIFARLARDAAVR